MADFAAEVRRFMTERGMSLRRLARAVSYDPSYLSKVLSGRKPYSPYLAARLDDALEAGGKIRDAADEQAIRLTDDVRSPSSGKPPRVVEALQTALSAGTAGPDIAIDGLTDLVAHYSHAIAASTSAQAYDELLSVRSFANTLLSREGAARHSDLVVTAGWLSGLLAISATDLGDHASALVWCSDTARRGRDAGHPELEGWAVLTRALIAYYQGQAPRSATLARYGEQVTRPGTVAYAKLAAQEMRSLAMMGDADGMADARRAATTAMEVLPPGAGAVGAFSIPLAEDPPYTATSLLLVGRYREAAEATRQVIDTVYRGNPRGQPAKYARTLLILGLAEARLGRIDAASAAGRAALRHGRPAWMTMVLAGKLDQFLVDSYPASAHTAGYHAAYADAIARVDRPASRLSITRGSSA